jgi:transcriptional/translational regulatory protein YebC/TACO1
MIYAPFSDFGSIAKVLEERGHEILNSGFERIPMDTKKMNIDQHAEVDKLLEKIEEDEDVQAVYHNMV